MSCSDCAFWKFTYTEEDIKYGKCRIRAPLATTAFAPDGWTPRICGGWPETTSDDHCGEFKRKEVSNAE